MSDAKLDKVAKRRAFLKNAAVVGGVVTAMAVTRGSQAASVESQESEVNPKKGYRLTKHIRDYYATARS